MASLVRKRLNSKGLQFHAMENIPSTSSSAHEPDATSELDIDRVDATPIGTGAREPDTGGSSSAANGTLDSTNTREYLDGLWNKGMTNSKKGEAKQLMMEAVAVTKLKYSQIKNFIDNKRRQEVKATKIKISKMGKRRLYDIFMSLELNKYCDNINLSKEEKMKLAHDSWKKNKNDPTTLAKLRRLKDEAATESTDQASDHNLNFKATKLLMRKWVKDIDNKCEAMNDLGYECLFLAVHRTEDDYNEAGTDQALVVAKQQKFIYQLNSAVTPEETTSGSLESLSDGSLRSRLQAHFNDAYMKSLGKLRTEYDRIGAGKVRVTGMPPGIPFRRPGTYGRQTKIRILQEAVNIKFSVVNDEEGDVPDAGVQNSEDALPVPVVNDEEGDVPDAGVQNSEDALPVPVVNDEEGDVPDAGVQNSEDALPVPGLTISDEDDDALGLYIHHTESSESILLPMATGERPRGQKKRKRKNAGKRPRKNRRAHDKSEEEEGQRYIVEEILKKKAGPANEKQLFLVKWEGYPAEQATWEPRLNLPRSMVTEFLTK